MLKTFRKKGFAKKVLWTLAIILILSFGLFGTANYLTRAHHPTSRAGTIFGKGVAFEDFQKGLLHTRTQAIMTYGDNFKKVSQLLNLDQETWDRLILLYEARHRKIKISDDEVVKAIENMKFFQEDGQFRSDFYERIVRYVFECTPRDFEEGMRESLMLAKLYEQETAAVTATEEEIRQEYAKQNEKVQVNFVLMNADAHKGEVTVTEQELKNHYDQYKNDFFVPPAINVEYLQLPYPEKKEEIDESQFVARINVIAEDLKKSQNVKETVDRHGVVYGESGFFNLQQPNLKIAFDDKLLATALKLEEGQISDPVKTEQGYFILKLKKQKEAYVPEFPEAKPKVEETVIKIKSQEVAKVKTEEFLKKIKESLTANPALTFAEAAQGLGLKLEETAPFLRGEYLPLIGLSKDFQDAAFNLNDQNKLSDVVAVPKGFALLYLKSRTAVDEKKFAEEKVTYEKAFLTKRKTETFSSFINSLRSQAQLEDNISKLRQEASQPKTQSNEE